MTPEQLRQLALRSWEAYRHKRIHDDAGDYCEEDEADLLNALDEAVRRVDEAPGEMLSGDEVRARLALLISK